MRRKDREVTDIKEILDIIDRCPVCHLGMSVDNTPYIVPMNFGYSYLDGELTLYFHGALEGRKVDFLTKNKNICFCIDLAHELIVGTAASAYSYKYESVMGTGVAEFIEGDDEKIYALNNMMSRLTKREADLHFPPEMLKRTLVFKVVSRDFTAKRNLGNV